MASTPARRPRRGWRIAGRTLLLLLATLLLISTLTNRLLPDRTAAPGQLSPLDRARAEEVIRLRQTFGDSLWPGFGRADIPLILYNEAYAFLIGYAGAPPDGWRKVPAETSYGGPWERIEGLSVGGVPVYRLALPEGRFPEAFTVRVGERWAASMTLRDWTVIRMGNELRDALPPPLRLFVPYRLLSSGMSRLFGADWFISAVEHESLHAWQGQVAPGRLARAETLLAEAGGRYPWDDPAHNASWKAETTLLVEALKAPDDARATELVRDFLRRRRERRLTAGLDSTLTELERLREWEEGLAKYTELALWKAAARDSSYQAVAELAGDPAFRHYLGFDSQWKRELSTMAFQGGGGESRFYYSGMAQAFLLDRLRPGWRAPFPEGERWLEEALEEAVGVE